MTGYTAADRQRWLAEVEGVGEDRAGLDPLTHHGEQAFGVVERPLRRPGAVHPGDDQPGRLAAPRRTVDVMPRPLPAALPGEHQPVCRCDDPAVMAARHGGGEDLLATPERDAL